LIGDFMKLDRVYFHAARDIPEEQMLNAVQHILPATKVEWIADPLNYEGNFIPGVLYVERQTGAGQFKFGYDVQFLTEKVLTQREKVGVLQRLAKQFSVPSLVPTDDIDPYTFISIEDDGFVSSVGVETEPFDQKNEVTIDGPFNFSFGVFALQEALTNSEEMFLTELFKAFIANFDIVPIGKDLFNPDFRNYKNTSIPLRGYNYYYMIAPYGKNAWYSKEEKSNLLVEQMTTFSRESKKDVCLFTADSTTIENIPGGSDHESACLNITSTGIERIVYKARRKSWLRS
jgi:hypothetical protein